MARNELTLSPNKLKDAIASYKGETKKVEWSIRSHRGKQVGFSNATDEEATRPVSLDLNKCPRDFLEHFLKVGDLTENQRRSIMEAMGLGAENVGIHAELSDPIDVHNMIATLGTKDRNLELRIGPRWYPVTVRSEVSDYGYQNEKYCSLKVVLDLTGFRHEQSWAIGKSTFMDSTGAPQTMHGDELLEQLNLRIIQGSIEEHNDRCLRASIMSPKTGLVMDCIGGALVMARNFGGYGSFLVYVGDVGSKEIPKKVVIDDSLEIDKSHGNYGDKTKPDPMPFVRCFNLETKRWMWADVDDFVEHQFDTNATERLVLPETHRRLLDRLFRTDVKTLFGDVLTDKHGGMIILANGSAGVGKTLTAEIFSEITKKPLYVMEMYELGLKVEEIEGNLDRIFKRVTRWNAVLLMDECDIFLAQRGSDLRHNVLVGIFLRLMDYYRGLLFLTSNRAEVIDEAFRSRITLKLDYPKLDRDARHQVWKIMLHHAGIHLDTLDGIPDVELNGRQIRNMVRLIRAIYGKDVKHADVLATIEFACK